MPLIVHASSEHASLPVDAGIDDEEIVVLGKSVFVHQVTTTFFPIATDFLAALNEAAKYFLATLTLSKGDRVMIFRDV